MSKDSKATEGTDAYYHQKRLGKTTDKKDILGKSEDEKLGLLKELLVYDIIQDSNTDCRETQFCICY